MRPFTLAPRAPAPSEVLAAAPAVSLLDDELNRAACALIDKLIEDGEECGLHVVAYHRGKLVLDVVAGVHARQEAPLDSSGRLVFEPVTPETRFMCYSVAKGVVATVIARALDLSSSDGAANGRANPAAPAEVLSEGAEGAEGRTAEQDEYADPFDRPVASLWPEFGQCHKGGITIGDALSHRAGLKPFAAAPLRLIVSALTAMPLRASAGAALLSAALAAVGGMRSFAAARLRLCTRTAAAAGGAAAGRHGAAIAAAVGVQAEAQPTDWAGLAEEAALCGEEWIAGCAPSWPYNRALPRALYHPTSWSWLALGLGCRLQHTAARKLSPCPPAVRGGCPRTHLRDGVRELALALRLPPAQLCIGELAFPHTATPAARSGGMATGAGVGAKPVALSGRPVVEEGQHSISLLLASHGRTRLPAAPLAECAGPPLRWLLRTAGLEAAQPQPEAQPVCLRTALGSGGVCVLCARLLAALCLVPLVLCLCVGRWLLLRCALPLGCALEVWAMCALGNSRPFLALCLPSSNLLAAARPLGRLYGALANGGSCEGSAQVLSARLLATLCAHAMDEQRDAPAPAPLGRFLPAGRYTCGFSPWLGAIIERHLARAPRPTAAERSRASEAEGGAEGRRQHRQPARPADSARSKAAAHSSPTASVASGSEGSAETDDSSAAHARSTGGVEVEGEEARPSARRCVLGHNGVGGCVAYADVHSGIAFVLLKNVYTPELAQTLRPGGPGLCATARALDALVRAHVLD